MSRPVINIPIIIYATGSINLPVFSVQFLYASDAIL